MKTLLKLYNTKTCPLQLKKLHLDWKFNDNGIEKEFQFLNFVKAFEFMTQVAVVAEEQKHHPEWKNVYNKLQVRLTTHDSGGVTDKDFDLALALEQLLKQ
ncbi:MAG: 4a-hydroxytetrahydrobiopterin dehydratase [Flavobacteriaceae bacterium]|jgi:4a-hydroxytetrahydrobiopterin dehydratase|nr:4a-hydroxytetrahydrobiopterin dehydratase [Candidatus Arcticimaribacter sp.]